MVYDSEWNFAVLDEATRRTGRLVKVVRAYSCKGYSLKGLNFKFIQRDAEEQTARQDLYPQLLGCQLFCDLPRAIHWLWVHLISPLLPVRTREKTSIVDTSSRRDLSLLDRHIKPEERPAWLGGTSTKSITEAWENAAMPPLGQTSFRRYDEPGFEYLG
jgi:hypothetical protein